MANIIDCPSCHRRLRVPDELLGANVKCPTCQTVFTTATAATPPRADLDAPADVPEQERVSAKPQVNRPTDDPAYPGPYDPGLRRDLPPHRGTMILVFGILSIVFAVIYFLSPIGLGLGIAGWVMGQRDLRKMREGTLDPQGLGVTQAGWICSIIGTIFCSLCAVGCMVYFGFILTLISTGQMR